MNTEDDMVLAVDALKSLNLQGASDEALGLLQTLLCTRVKEIAREQSARITARFNTQMEMGEYEVELEVIRGGKV